MISAKHLKKIYKTHIRQNNIFLDVFHRAFKEHIAVDDVSFEIAENELVGFIGPNGAGKTTTLKMLAGILHPTAGEVRVFGVDPFLKSHSFLMQIAFVMGQRNQLIWDLPASDSFILQKTIYEIEESEYKKTLSHLADILSCEKLIEKPVKTLSLGERMKMELIAGLLHRPKLVFFDEPTIGLDIFSQEAIREFIREYQQTYRATVILTSHYLEDVKQLAKRLIIINKGRILYDDTLNTIIERYSKAKQIRITLSKPVPLAEIKKIKTPVSFVFPQIVFTASPAEIPEMIKKISVSLPFSDLTVEDESIEEIIKTFFEQQK